MCKKDYCFCLLNKLLKRTNENKNISMEALYPLIEIMFTSIARSEPPDRDEYLVNSFFENFQKLNK